MKSKSLIHSLHCFVLSPSPEHHRNGKKSCYTSCGCCPYGFRNSGKTYRYRLVKGHSPEGQGCGHSHHRQGHQHQVRLLLRQDRGRHEHAGTLRRFRRRAPRSRRHFFYPHAKKESPAALVMLQGFYQDGDYLLSHLRSTIGVTKLNFSVRNGKRWNLRAIVT